MGQVFPVRVFGDREQLIRCRLSQQECSASIDSEDLLVLEIMG